jgi:hypothetical protein
MRVPLRIWAFNAMRRWITIQSKPEAGLDTVLSVLPAVHEVPRCIQSAECMRLVPLP